MTPQTLIQIILSAGFASAVTDILRKLIPSIDGVKLVWGVAMILSILGNVLLMLVQGKHDPISIGWAAGYGIAGGVAAIAGNTMLDAHADRCRTAPAPAKLPIDRDTDRMS